MMSLLVTIFNLLICTACVCAVVHVQTMYGDIKDLMIDLDFLYNRLIDLTEAASPGGGSTAVQTSVRVEE